jgi:hypothetical protein
LKFLLQFQKQQEDSTIPPASNRPHSKDQTKKDRNGKERGKTKNKRVYRELLTHKKFPTDRTQSKVIPKMPKTGILNRDFPLRTNHVVFLRTTSEGWHVAFGKTTTPTTWKTLMTIKSQEIVKLTTDNPTTTMPPQPQRRVTNYAGQQPKYTYISMFSRPAYKNGKKEVLS